MRAWWRIVIVMTLVGCSSDIRNQPSQALKEAKPIRWQASVRCMNGDPVQPRESREELALHCLQRPEREHDFVALALSGGGTKAAVFSAESMFYLEALGLLDRASVLSSVSGGSFTAALYALSCDPGDTHNLACSAESTRGLVRPVWDHAAILKTVGQGYSPLATEQVARWFVPFVAGSITAGGFARYIDKNYFKTGSSSDARFEFRDLNPRRPHLILNSTILSPNRAGIGDSGNGAMACFGRRGPRGWLRRRNPDEYFHFAYTDIYFNLIQSDLSIFPVAGGVAASGAFPVLIDQARLDDYCRKITDNDRQIILMDGGVNDNQGLMEIYLILTELVLGQRRSDTPLTSLERLGPADTAYIFVVNSSVTDTTGPTGTGTGSGPTGIITWASSVLSKVADSTDAYSADAYNLRKAFYTSETRRAAQIPHTAAIRTTEISLDGLDQYQEGGAQAALWYKAGVLDHPAPGDDRTDPDLRALRDRVALHAKVWKHLMPPEVRKALRLPHYHPQCYFDIRARLDASLLSLPDNEKACLRQAARWSTAIAAQELCEASAGVKPPEGLDCTKGAVSLLRTDPLGAPETLSAEDDVGGSCRAILKDFVQAKVAGVNGSRAPDPALDDVCQELPDG
jgi:hypothetical protein